MEGLDPKNGGAQNNEYQKYFDIMNNLNKKNAPNTQTSAPENQQPKTIDSVNLSEMANMNFSDFHSQSTPGSVQMSSIQPEANAKSKNTNSYMGSVSMADINANSTPQTNSSNAYTGTQTGTVPNYQSYNRADYTSAQPGTANAQNSYSSAGAATNYQSYNRGSVASQPSSTSSSYSSGSTSQTGSYGSTSQTGSYGSTSQTGSYGSTSQTGSYGSTSQTGSYGSTSQTGSYGRTSQTGSYGSTSQTGSYGSTSQTGSYGSTSQTGSYGSTSQSGAYGTAPQTSSYGSTQSSSNRGLYADYKSNGFNDTRTSSSTSSFMARSEREAVAIRDVTDRMTDIFSSPRSSSRTLTDYFKGALGAVIGALPGFGLLILLENIGYVAALTGIVLFLGSFYLYAFLSGNGADFDKIDLGIVIGVCVAAIYLGVKISYVMAFQDVAPELTFGELFWHFSDWLSLAEATGSFVFDLFLTIVLSALGAVKVMAKK